MRTVVQGAASQAPEGALPVSQAQADALIAHIAQQLALAFPEGSEKLENARWVRGQAVLGISGANGICRLGASLFEPAEKRFFFLSEWT